MTSRWRTVVMAAAIAWPVAAGAAPRDHRDHDRDDKEVVTAPKQVKSFNVGPTGSLKLANVAGDVSVTGGSGSEIKIESDRVSKTLTRRARAVRVIKTEQARFRRRVNSVVILALETLGEPHAFGFCFGSLDERCSVSFLETDFERIDEPLANVRTRGQTIDEHEHVLEIVARVSVG